MKIIILITSLIAVILTNSCEAKEDVFISTVAYEASGESFEGQVLVAKVIFNRMKERCQTAEEVCWSKSQFSCWKDGKPTQDRKLKSSELIKSANAISIAQDRLFNANIYMHKDCRPRWLIDALFKGTVKEILTLGNHTFYREI